MWPERSRSPPSPITIGLVVVLVFVAGLSLVVLTRGGRPTSTSNDGVDGAASPPVITEAMATTRRSRPAPVAARGSSRAAEGIFLAAKDRRPDEGSAAATVVPSRDAEAEASDARRPSVSEPRRRRIHVLHNQVLNAEADERIFAARKLPDATRAAIRRINAQFVRDRLDSPDGSRTPAAGTVAQTSASSPGAARTDLDAERARRDALSALLGPEEAASFETAERLTARTLAPRFRRQWARELARSPSGDPLADPAADPSAEPAAVPAAEPAGPPTPATSAPAAP